MAIRQQPKTFGQALQQFQGGRGIKTEPVTVVSKGSTTAYVRTASGFVLPAAVNGASVNVGDTVTMQDDRGRLSIVAGGGAGGAGGSGALFTGGSAVTFSGAPSTASYLTLGSDATLTSERVFTKGSGLAATDGGAGGAYTLAVGQGNGITVSTNDVAVNQGYGFTWTATHDFQNGLYIGTDVWLTRLASNVLALGTGDSFRSQGYTSGVSGWQIDAAGTAEFENVRVRGELAASVFKINEMSATAGTFGVWYSAGTVYADFTTPASVSGTGTMQAKNSDAGGMLFGVNDYVQLKSWTGSGVSNSWLRIDSRTNNTTYTTYGYTLMSGSTSATFRAGTAIADWGPSGSGAITLSADGTIGSTANLSIMTHAGSPWSTTTLVTRLGNLNGSYNYTSTAYGLGVGDYSGGNYLKFSPTADASGRTGFELVTGSNAVMLSPNGIRIGVTTGGWLGGGDPSDIAFQTSPLSNTGTVAAVGVSRQTVGVTATYMGVSLDDTGASRTNTVEIKSSHASTRSASVALISDASTASIEATATTIRLIGSTVADKINVGTATSAPTGFVFQKNDASAGGPQTAYQTSGTGTPDWRVGIPATVNANDFFIFDNSSGGFGQVLRFTRATGATTLSGITTVSTAFNVGSSTGTTTGVGRASVGWGAGDAVTPSKGGFFGRVGASDGGPQFSMQAATTNAADWRIGIPGSAGSENFFVFDNSTSGAGTVMTAERGTGRVGVGTASPQARLHTYDTDGGTLHNWRTTGIGASRVTIVANGTGDCTQSCSVFGTAYDSSGNAWELRGSLESGVSAGSEQTVQVAGDATDNIHVKVKTDGQVEIVRNAGARTWSVCLSAWWR